MRISYNWLCEYLAEEISIDRLSKILTSVGLEVEAIEPFENLKGGLKGLLVGEVIECEKHPNADKLSVTKVNIGTGEALQIVCGANNVAKGQKVVVAPIGATIYPLTGESLTMEKRKIRGIESQGMICAEDEIGLSNNHDGILVLPNEVEVGTLASNYFDIYTDYAIEIGITPNRMDAMSHLGVAKDVLAYLIHHDKKETKLKLPFSNNFKADNTNLNIEVEVKDTAACPRYAGVSISGVTVSESPAWLKNKLQTIGVRSINNIVDITNYILHETGLPLHAFDAGAIAGNKIIVQCLAANTAFISLDEKERKLAEKDLMICDGNDNPLCIAGVFGGLNSGVSAQTTNIFLESACFNASFVRQTSMHHGLRTDAAVRFEKGIDINNTVNVLKRAALLIKEIAGGEISSNIIDVYEVKEKKQVQLKYHYLKKLSGKNYHPDAVKKILTALDFEVIKEGIDDIWVAVPFSKPDISLAADIVEEIVRIDGLDNIEIPANINLSPAVDTLGNKEQLKEKIADYLVGQGFNEILTNSITNSKYFSEDVLATTVKMLNSLSADLDAMRPTLLHSGLETIAFNVNRKNSNIRLFEFGKIYSTPKTGTYIETEHIAIFISGKIGEDNWKQKQTAPDMYTAKGLCQAIAQLSGLKAVELKQENQQFDVYCSTQKIGKIIQVDNNNLQKFDIKQTVFYIDLNFEAMYSLVQSQKIVYREVPKFPAVQRDLALVLNKEVQYVAVETQIDRLKINKLKSVRLFDIFESDKLGANKKSLAVNFTFLDEEKTLTDKEVDGMMNKLINQFEKELGAEIRK